MQSTVKSRVLLALLGGLLVLLALAPRAALGAESGVNINLNPIINPRYAADVRALHPQWVRLFIGWYGIEPGRGQFNPGFLANYQRVLAQLPHGTKVDVALVGTPAWASADGSSSITAPPNPADYAAAIGFLASHYRGLVTAWEIWNEPNSPAFFSGSATQYAQLLQAAYPAVKAADPAATVVLGGLVGNDYSYLAQLYAAGAGGAFDAVGIHTDTACNVTSPYTYMRDYNGFINQYSFLGYRGVHAVMVARGDGAKPIYMTEIGWNTATGVCQNGLFANQKAAGVSEPTQATFLNEAFHCLAGDPYVAVAIWFQLQDNGANDSAGDRFGLLSASYRRKPAFDALTQLARSGDQVGGLCGNFTGPRITIMAPQTMTRYKRSLRIAVSATSLAGVHRITLYHDGKTIRNFGQPHAAPTVLNGTITWQGARRLSRGQHVITVLARDRQGNMSTLSVTVVHA